MLIPFFMFVLDSDQGKVKYSPLYARGKQCDDFGRSPFSIRKVANRHFQSEMLPIERSSKKNLVGTHFC